LLYPYYDHHDICNRIDFDISADINSIVTDSPLCNTVEKLFKIVHALVNLVAQYVGKGRQVHAVRRQAIACMHWINVPFCGYEVIMV
jgi:hypothetical protein